MGSASPLFYYACKSTESLSAFVNMDTIFSVFSRCSESAWHLICFSKNSLFLNEYTFFLHQIITFSSNFLPH